jgi:predicted RNA-binding Zn-ribbon protein involved in translation (DUF1610 family)
MAESDCPICNEKLSTDAKGNPHKDAKDFDCPNCGNFSLSGSLVTQMHNSPYDERGRAVLSHAIRKADRDSGRPLFTTYFAGDVVKQNYLPGIEEQIENLILYVGDSVPEAGATTALGASTTRAVLGCMRENASGWIIKQAFDAGLVQGNAHRSYSTEFSLLDATLSLSGWREYSKLLSSGTRSKRAFMAMKFGDAELDRVFFDYFKPACDLAGFELLKLDEQPRAGLIDDRLRVDIKRSRFLVADLSHANNGAYWEAGYAEGLGRPVIYTCPKDVFDDVNTRPHFDTNHHLTITWDPTNPVDAARQLTAVIRVTLPGEAKLSDD